RWGTAWYRRADARAAGGLPRPPRTRRPARGRGGPTAASVRATPAGRPGRSALTAARSPGNGRRRLRNVLGCGPGPCRTPAVATDGRAPSWAAAQDLAPAG